MCGKNNFKQTERNPVANSHAIGVARTYDLKNRYDDAKDNLKNQMNMYTLKI